MVIDLTSEDDRPKVDVQVDQSKLVCMKLKFIYGVNLYAAKLLFHQSPTIHSPYTVFGQ